jgi:pilus assembly protein Flp/PilA
MSHCSTRALAAIWLCDSPQCGEEKNMVQSLNRLWSQDEGQDVAEYAVMLAVVLVIVVGTIQLIGSSANTVFSSVGSAMQ